MKLCSWDVGIKNLAYCIISKNGDDFEVEKWNVINIVDSDKIICCGLQKKNNKVCGKKAKYIGSYDGAIKYYCGTHKKQFKPLDDDWEQTLFVLNKEQASCSYKLPKKGTICGKKARYKHNTDTLCNQHKKLVVNKTKKDIQVKIIKKKRCTSIDPKKLAILMYNKLDQIPELLDVDEVIIENQPTLINASMKRVSSILFSYFVIRGIIDKKRISNVKFFSPSNKLKVKAEKIDNIMNGINEDGKIYTIIKKLFVKYLELSEDDDGELVDKFGSTDKLHEFIKVFMTCLLNKTVGLEKLESAELYNNTVMTKESFCGLNKKIEKEKDKKIYVLTKLLGIKYTEALVDDSGCWLDKHKKKDDMCDAFLQGYYHLLK